MTQIAIDPECLSVIPAAVIQQYGIIPIKKEGDSVYIATSAPDDLETLADIRFISGLNVIPVQHEERLIAESISAHYADELNVNLTDSKEGKDSQNIIVESASEIYASTASIVELIDNVIAEAISLNASDIHVEPYEALFRVRFRIDGYLTEQCHLPLDKKATVISRLKVMAAMDIAEKRRPQDGRIQYDMRGRPVDIRVSTLPTNFGEKVVLRLLDKERQKLRLDQLGFEDAALSRFSNVLRSPYGIILVTGPTGSGKTTTLYAALNELNSQERNIVTVEDPIEYAIEGINQSRVRADLGYTFAAALRTLLRQDPNVIMVGEIRDSETAEIAVRASLTGHLVLSTLHTNDACTAIMRLVDMGVEPFLLASSLRLVIAQRLVRQICPECGKRIELPKERLDRLMARSGVTKLSDISDPTPTWRKGEGCAACHQSGFRGRIALFELLEIDSHISDMILGNASLNAIKEQALNSGMCPLRRAGLAKAARGITTLDEILRETDQ
ncbi:MAG: GspE/PulE family protein [candidate division KSB1 bacterium]|jgi:type IV pilus assembly protein PilB|nr:GspE/PulE family protein [candidate division KSB1 bacterium]